MECKTFAFLITLTIIAGFVWVALINLCENSDICITNEDGHIIYQNQIINTYSTKPNTTFYCYWEPPFAYPQKNACYRLSRTYCITVLVLCICAFIAETISICRARAT